MVTEETRMRARLTLEIGDCAPQCVELVPGQPATLGRSRDSTVVLQEDLASRLHAKVYFEEGRWVVRDFGLNGTRVNGLKVNGASELAHGATLQIGTTVFQFSFSDVKEPGSSSRSLTETAARPPTYREMVDTNLETANPEQASFNSPERQATAAIAHAVDRRTPEGIRSGKKGHLLSDSLLESAASQLKVDELTALCRFMTAAVELTDPHAMIRLALRSVLTQTAAKVAGYLSLDPSDPSPKFVFPDQSTVDVPLSRRLTERVRTEKKTIWHSQDTAKHQAQPGTESLFAYQDALCLPLSANGEIYAALHVYRTGTGFSERDVRFIEAIGGYLSRGLELHRNRRKLEAENNRLRASVPTADELIGDSTAIMSLRQQIAKAAPLPFTVLIHGDSGSGKELVAQALHTQSNRAGGPLVVVNCAAITPTLLEAELFGYRKGAFSGADRDHPGLFEQADEGTLFLDEVGELTLECQAKLLRVIEGKPFRPVGGTKDVKVDVRVIAATHRDLEREVRSNKFRQDLLFRLKVISLRVPSLREHAEDIPELAGFFLERLSVQCRRSFKLTSAAARKLQAYTWPGNVRQLRAVLESAAVMTDSETIDAADLPLGAVSEPISSLLDLPPGLDIDTLETWAIRKAMKQTGGNVSRSAQILGMSRDTLHTKLKKKGITRDDALIADHVGSAAES